MREQHYEQIKKKIYDMQVELIDLRGGIQRRDRDELERMILTIQAMGVDLNGYLEASCFEEHPQAAKKFYKKDQFEDRLATGTWINTEEPVTARMTVGGNRPIAQPTNPRPSTQSHMTTDSGITQSLTSEGELCQNEEVEIRQNSATEIQF